MKKYTNNIEYCLECFTTLNERYPKEGILIICPECGAKYMAELSWNLVKV